MNTLITILRIPLALLIFIAGFILWLIAISMGINRDGLIHTNNYSLFCIWDMVFN